MLAWTLIHTELQANQDTNSQTLIHPLPENFENSSRMSLDFGNRYPEEIFRHQGVIIDRIGPPSYFEQARHFGKDGYAYHDYINSAGSHGIEQLLVDSARETAVAIITPNIGWYNLNKLLSGSIGNTEEERFPTVSASYSQARESWWQSLTEDGSVRYGLRPWRKDPYGYVSIRVGHWNGVPLAIIEGLAGYRIFGSGRVGGNITMPLPGGLQLAGGVSNDSFVFRSRDQSHT